MDILTSQLFIMKKMKNYKMKFLIEISSVK